MRTATNFFRDACVLRQTFFRDACVLRKTFFATHAYCEKLFSQRMRTATVHVCHSFLTKDQMSKVVLIKLEGWLVGIYSDRYRAYFCYCTLQISFRSRLDVHTASDHCTDVSFIILTWLLLNTN